MTRQYHRLRVAILLSYLASSSNAFSIHAPSTYSRRAPLLILKSSLSYLDSIDKACNYIEPDPECAGAISNYLDALSTGAAEPQVETAAAITSYLDNIGGALPPRGAAFAEAESETTSSSGAVTSYLDAISTGIVEAPTETAVERYLGAISEGEVATPTTGGAITGYLSGLGGGEASSLSGAGVASYLDAMSGSGAPAGASGIGGSGMSSYLDTVAPASSTLSGSGIGSFTDSLNEACDFTQPTEDCADAITSYLDALSAGATQPQTEAASTISSYMDNLGETTKEEPSIESSAEVAAAVSSYLDDIAAGQVSAPSRDAVGTYLQEISSGKQVVPNSEASLISCLSNPEQDPLVHRPGPGTPKGVWSPSYADTINEACDFEKPTEDCADAITGYLDAVSSGEEQPKTETAAKISGYLDSISTEHHPPQQGTKAVTSYLDALAHKTIDPPTEKAVTTYINAISEGMIISPGSQAQLVSCLSNPQATGRPNVRSNRSRDTGNRYANFRDVFQGTGSLAPRKVQPAAGSSEGKKNYNDVVRQVRENRDIAVPKKNGDPNRAGIQPSSNQSDVGRSVRGTKNI